MLGPEVKRSRLMIDDADLQPEVVHFGERLGKPMRPRSRCPAHCGDPLLPSRLFTGSTASFTHSEAHHVFILRGRIGRGLDQGMAKVGGSRGQSQAVFG